MPLTPVSEEQETLNALCEVGIKVHVGEEAINVHPPTLSKLNATAPLWATVIDKVDAMGDELKKKTKNKKDVDVEAVIKNIWSFVDDLLPIFKIFLAPRGSIDSKYSLEELKGGLDIGDMKRILVFIREGVQVGELMKNAVLPVRPVGTSETVLDGRRSSLK